MHITPTVGRVVWFRPSTKDPLSKSVNGEPLAGHVARVNDDGTVNLMVISSEGLPESRKRVPLCQGDSPRPKKGGASWCEWMPYQVALAKTGDPAFAMQQAGQMVGGNVGAG